MCNSYFNIFEKLMLDKKFHFAKNTDVILLINYLAFKHDLFENFEHTSLTFLWFKQNKMTFHMIHIKFSASENALTHVSHL